MIAALAAGLLGQLEGIGAAGKGLTAVSSLASSFTVPDDIDATEQNEDVNVAKSDAAAISGASPPSHAGILHGLSNQLHGLLLQNQQVSPTGQPGRSVIGTDDISGIVAHLA